MGYFEVRKNRLESYHKNFLELAENLKKKGFLVSTHNRGDLIRSIKVLDKNNNGLRIQFNEVPYRFSFEYDIKPSKNGSGYTGKEFGVIDGYDFPFTVKEILSSFQPMYIDTRFSNYQKQL